MKKILLLTLCIPFFTVKEVDAQNYTYFVEAIANTSIPSSSGDAPAIETEYTLATGVWKFFKAYRTGTSCGGAAILDVGGDDRALRFLNAQDGYVISPVLSNGVSEISFTNASATTSSRRMSVSVSYTDNGNDWTFLQEHTMTSVASSPADCAVYKTIVASDKNPLTIKRVRLHTNQAANVDIDNITIKSITPLPLSFLSFAAKPDALGKSVSLNWQTTNEVNTKEFIVEKRTATTEFTEIGRRPSNNTSGIHNYSFTDNSVSNGVVYYRLKQVDNDGVFDYSSVASADVKGNLSFSIYPNPTADVLNVVHESVTAASAIKVLNLSGKTLIENAVSLGSTTTNIDVSSLSDGAYILMYDGNHQNTLKFIKK